MELMDAASTRKTPADGGWWLAAGGIVGALLASSCCIVPLVLVTLGVSGAWIGNLSALAPYNPLFVAITLACLAGGFWHVYLRRRPACLPGSQCARPSSAMFTKTALWTATALVLAAMTMSWWAPLFY
jgi:mercuric ion transport protein